MTPRRIAKVLGQPDFVHLQSYGDVPQKPIEELRANPGKTGAIPLEQLEPGMLQVFNWGHTSEVLRIEPTKSGNSYSITYRGKDGGEITTRSPRRGTTLVAVRFPKP